MNVHARRTLARAGLAAAAAFAAGAFAAPAYADDTADLELSVTGTTVAVEASGKIGAATITNRGPATAVDVTLAFDTSGLDATKVEFPLPHDEACEQEGSVVTCGVKDVPVDANFDLGFALKLKAGAAGDAGELVVTVAHAGTDPVADNNSKAVEITVNGSGADLGVVAEDVYQLDDEGNLTDDGVAPGGTSFLFVFVRNQGDVTVNGVKLDLKLPAHVTLTTPEPSDCTHEAGAGATTCEYDVTLVPAKDDTDPEDGIESSGWFFWEVKVAGGTAGPAGLTGGIATAVALALDVPEVEIQSVPTKPENFTTETPAGLEDVDPTDNTDEFTVFVAGATGGGSLPITGVKVGLIGGAGLAVLVAGGLLFLLARRRRVVLVTPTDG